MIVEKVTSINLMGISEYEMQLIKISVVKYFSDIGSLKSTPEIHRQRENLGVIIEKLEKV